MPTAKWFLALLVVVSGCSAVDSSYIAPRTIHFDPASYDESRLIPYRTLVRADFLARLPPAGMESEFVAAVTAALIRTSHVTISTRARSQDGSTLFLATVENLRFEARMSQNHSWWNPHHASSEGQLLVHEQIHFAFSELAVRRANAQLEQIKTRIRAVARTPEAAVRAAEKKLQQEVDRVQAEVHARNVEFDRETVNGRIAETNQHWFERVQDELERSRSQYLALSSASSASSQHAR